MVKKKVCKIYLFRHGVTSDNANGVFCGWRDVGLTSKGVRDAKIVALRLKDKPVDVWFHSGLKRSKQTLKYVLKFHPGDKKIIEDKRMMERSYGNLEGNTHLKIVKKFGYKQYDLWHRGYEVRPPKGESIHDVEKRVLKFVKYLLDFIKKNKVSVGISAHGNSMRPFRRYFEKFSIKQMCSLYNDYEAVHEYSVKC